jgi:hypothetical protein
MNLRAPSLIHKLTFDIACAGAAGDGVAMADWIKEALLPVMEEVFDQQDRPGRIRRVAQLEIDLGTVSRDESRVELARRLFAQLSEALASPLEGATASSLVEEREQRLGEHLLDFLRTGRLDWSVAADGRVAHRQLLRRVLESLQAAEVLRAAIDDPRMLSRLLRQFDADELNSVAQLLSRSLPERERAEQERAAASGGRAEAAGTEAHWRRLLQTSARSSTERRHRDSLHQLRRMLANSSPARRDALREIWSRLLQEIRQRIGKRGMSALSSEAMSDLSQILRPRAAQLFSEFGGAWEPSQIDVILQLLLADEDAIATADSLLAGQSEQIPVAASNIVEPIVQPTPDANAADLQAVIPSHRWGRLPAKAGIDAELAGDDSATAVQALLASTNDQPPATQTASRREQLDDEANRALSSPNAKATKSSFAPVDGNNGSSVDGPKSLNSAALPPDAQKSLALLARLLPAFNSEQLAAFEHIWQRLSAEVAIRTAGRDVATLTTTQKYDLALIMHPIVAAQLKELGHQDQAHLVGAVAQLLLAGADTATMMQAMLASTGDQPSPTQTASRRERPDDEANHRVSSSNSQNSLALLARLWNVFSADQRTAFGYIWQRLSEVVASHDGRRELPTLDITQEHDLALILRPLVAAQLKELGHHEEPHLVESLMQLLQAGEDDIAAVESLLASPSEQIAVVPSNLVAPTVQQPPAGDDAIATARPMLASPSDSAARRKQRDDEANHPISSPDAQKSLAVLARVRSAFSSDQRTAFGHIWQRLSAEFAIRTAGRDLTMLTAIQKYDLAQIMHPLVVAQLKELGHKDEIHLVEALMQLLLADDDTSTAAQMMLASADDLPSAPRAAARREQLDDEANQRVSPSNSPNSLALLARLWNVFSAEQRAVFGHIWQTLSDAVASQAGRHELATPDITQKHDLTLLLRPLVAAQLKELGHYEEPHLVESLVQLLLAGEDAIAAVDLLLASPSEQIAIVPLNLVEPIAQLPPAGDDATATARPMLANPGDKRPASHTAARRKQWDDEVNNPISSPDAEKSLALLARLWSVFSSDQRAAFGHIWQRLSAEFSIHIAGRDVTMLTATQKCDLALIMQPLVVAQLKGLGHQDETHLVEALVRLLLADDDTSTAVWMMLGSAGDLPSDPRAASRREQLNDEANQHISSLNTQKSLLLLARLWDVFSAEQRALCGHTWQALSDAVASHAGRRALATLDITQKHDLTLMLRPLVAAQLKELGHYEEPHLVESLVQLLLAGEDAIAAVDLLLASPSEQIAVVPSNLVEPIGQLPLSGDDVIATAWPMLASPSDKRPASDSAARRRDDEVNNPISSPDAQESLALLARLWSAFSSDQRTAFSQIWLRICKAVASHAGRGELATLDIAQKYDLTLILRPLVAAQLKELKHHEETHLVESIVQLLLAGEGAIAAVDSLLAGPSDTLPASHTAARRVQLDDEVNHPISPPDAQKSLALVARRWGTLSSEQHAAFANVRQRLAEAALSRTGGHDVVAAVAQLLLADDDAEAALKSLPPKPEATTDPVLKMFLAWRQGRIDILALTITLPDLRQWLYWWLLHDPRQVKQDCSLMLDAIDAQIQQVADQVLFMKLVLTSLKSGGPLDLDALSQQAGPAHETPPQPIASPPPPTREPSAVQQRTQLDGLNTAQLHQIIRAKIQPQGDEPSLFLEAIEAHALRAASIEAFLREVLQHLVSDQPVDLEQLLADTDSRTPPQATGDAETPVNEEAPARPTASPLPEQLRLALPQRLANAMLQADLASLEIIWPEITRAHATELAAAAQRYLSRADLRARLIEHTETAKLQDLLAAMSSWTAQLVEPILRHSAQYSAMLPTPLSIREFEQRVFRYAFEQALKPDISPIEWLHALISSVQEMNPDQRKQLAHGWYEVLRAGQKPALLLNVLDQALYEPSDHRRTASEPAASLLLMRQADLDAADHAHLASLLKNIVDEAQGTLEYALSDPQAMDRLTATSPTPVLARLLAVLKPSLAAQLPALLRQLHAALPIALTPVPATLDRRIWRAIYQAAFADDAVDGFPPAMVTRLATQYRQADPGAWLEKMAGAKSTATVTTTAATPNQALAQLLQPWAEPTAAPPAPKPTPAKHRIDEAPPLSGESNIHNAGMVIIAPYIQRLFNLLDLTVDGKFVSDEAAQRGVYLLQYAVTGEEATPEYLLVLNKLLCGIHGGVPIVAGISVTDKEKTTIEQMLNGVITHWSALGSTSIAGLRETFLQRQGHLYFQEDAWQLKIPTKTFDMLLDRLPWSFAMTKMPWMAQPLHVTWR